ncbi:hypothetical protein [Nonomuraea sp. JJY05]|uniref:hypothetical protein n=1 Tax=Nonomuraea sp. JJY05 TaxID=3350255 RepID=UPI00373F2816
MGEFVGIDPGGAEQLVRLMATGKNVLGRTRPGLEEAIAEAGASWTGQQGVAAMHRSWAFFDDTQRDLKWRVDTLKQMVPSSGNGLLGGSFTFNSETEAARQGKADGQAIAEALRRHEIENSPDSWRSVTAATTATKGKLGDPAYSAALLADIGPDKFRALFIQWMKKGRHATDKGLSPELLRQGRETLGPLAEAYANAERAGRLGEEWREKFMEKTPPGVLTALVAMSKPSPRLLNQVAMRVLGRPLNADLPTSENWNLNILLDAYEADPQALQTLLAENKDAAGWLLHPQRVRMSGIRGLEEKLAGVLDKALKPGAGDARVRERVWLNIISGMGAANSPWGGGRWGTFHDSPVSRALAKNVAPYLDELARGQAKRDNPDLKAVHPRPPWDDLDAEAASRFIGVLMQDKDAAKTLLKAAQHYTSTLDIGRFRPFGDEKIQDEYTKREALAGAAANLLLSGSAYAEWSDDEYADFVATVVTLPIDWLSNKFWPIQSATAATARDAGLDASKDSIKESIKNYLDGKTTNTPSTLADELVKKLAAWVNESLEEHNQKELTDSQRNQTEMALRGRLYDALEKALEARGG